MCGNAGNLVQCTVLCTVGTNPAKTCCIMSTRGPGPVNHPGHHVSLNLWSASCEITLNCYYVRDCVGDLMTLTVSTSEDNCLSLTIQRLLTDNLLLVSQLQHRTTFHNCNFQLMRWGPSFREGRPVSAITTEIVLDLMQARKVRTESVNKKMLSFSITSILWSQLIFSLSGHQLDSDRQFAWLITRKINLVILTNSSSKTKSVLLQFYYKR